jgi:hypothetical protein
MEAFETSVSASTSFHDVSVSLNPDVDPAALRVKATWEVDLTCNVNCTGFSAAGGSASVADIWIEVRPEMTVDSSPVVRGGETTVRILGVPEGAVSNWRFETNTPAVGTILRTTDTRAVTWPGQIVAGGTARANAIVPETAAGVPLQSYPLQTNVGVTPRTGWFSEAKPAVKVANGTSSPAGCSALTATLPDNCVLGQPPANIGLSEPCINWDPDPDQVNDDGPNHSLRWLSDLTDITTYYWTIHQNIENLTSDYCQHQCGNWSPGAGSTCANPIGSGYTTCSDLASAIARHEADPPQNSHYVQYVQAQNNPNNNIKAGAEAIVGPANQSQAQFELSVTQQLNPRKTAIFTQTANPHPCGSCTADCSQFLGHLNCKWPPTTGPWLSACSIALKPFQNPAPERAR